VGEKTLGGEIKGARISSTRKSCLVVKLEKENRKKTAGKKGKLRKGGVRNGVGGQLGRKMEKEVEKKMQKGTGNEA